MQASSILPPLPQFSGKNIDYPQHLKAARDLARRSGSNVSSAGIYPETFEDPDDNALHAPALGLDLPYVPEPGPGNRPILPAAPSAAQISLFNAEISQWKYLHERHTLANSERSTFLSTFLNTFPADTITAISDPIHGTALLSIREVFIALHARHGLLTSMDLEANEDSLSKPYVSGQLMRTHVKIHTDAHLVATANNQAFSEHKMTQAFLNSLKPCQLFVVQL